MKYLILLLTVFAIPAMADSSAGAVAGSQSQSGAAASAQSGSIGLGIGGGGGSANASNAGNSQAITFNSSGSDLGKAVGSVVMPALTTTLTDTCMGSASGGVGFSGFAGSFGKTYVDEECVRRLHSKFLATSGQGDVAMQIMCGSPMVAEAAATLAERTNGVDKCTGEQYAAAGPVETAEDYTWSYPPREIDDFIYSPLD